MKEPPYFPLFLFLIGCAALLGAHSTAAYEGGYWGDYSSWSPDETRIAFVWHSEEPADYADIYVVDADGSNLRNLTNTPNINESTFFWLADSQHLLLPLDVGHGILSLETGEIVRLSGRIWDSVISPDKTQVAYRSGAGDELIVTNFDGSRSITVTEVMPLFPDSDFYWSTDSQQIMYWSGPDVADQCQFVRTTVDDGSSQVLIANQVCDYHSSLLISPDGRYVSLYLQVDSNSQNLFVFDLVAGTSVNLYERFGSAFVSGLGSYTVYFWSPDGAFLMFPYDMEAESWGGVTLYDPYEQRIISLGAPFTIEQYQGIWSPDGRYLVIFHYAELVSLYAFDTETQEAALLIGSPRDTFYSATWSPDSTMLLVNVASSTEQPTESLILLSSDGAQLQQVLTHERSPGWTLWSADSEYFLFVTRTSDHQYVSVGSPMSETTYALVDRSSLESSEFQWSPTGHELVVMGDEGLSLYEVGLTSAELLWSIALPMTESGN